MFETMHSFLFFFIPTLALIICGIIFEERLIAFEQKIKNALTKKPAEKSNTTRVKRSVELSPVAKNRSQAHRRSSGKAA